MKTTLDKIENETKKIDKLAWIVVPIVFAVVLIAPFIFTRSWTKIDFSETGDIGSTIGGVTAPIIGLLSAFLVFISFRAQINANKYQLEEIYNERESRKYENEISFIYHRLEELKNNGSSTEFKDTLPAFNGLLDELIRTGYILIKNTIDDPILIVERKQKIQKIEHEKINLSLILSRQLSLYIMILNRLNELNSKIDLTQSEYINSTLRYEYLKNLSIYVKLYNEKLEKLTSHDLLNEKSLLINIKRDCIVLKNILNPSA